MKNWNTTQEIRKYARDKINRKKVKRLKGLAVFPNSNSVYCKMPLRVYSTKSIEWVREKQWDLPF